MTSIFTILDKDFSLTHVEKEILYLSSGRMTVIPSYHETFYKTKRPHNTNA